MHLMLQLGQAPLVLLEIISDFSPMHVPHIPRVRAATCVQQCLGSGHETLNLDAVLCGSLFRAVSCVQVLDNRSCDITVCLGDV